MPQIIAVLAKCDYSAYIHAVIGAILTVISPQMSVVVTKFARSINNCVYMHTRQCFVVNFCLSKLFSSNGGGVEQMINIDHEFALSP